ncbi:MAG: rRNA pseudouridine synthase [Sediminibacterium sp.]|nr:rRNA pseudouridine synthase [Sediminibacterium sp.]
MKQRTDNFSKFANQKKGSAIKEAFRQEKKKQKAAAQAEGEAIRRKKIEKAQGILPEKKPSFQQEKKGKYINKRGPQKPVAYVTYRPTEEDRKVSNKKTENASPASADLTAMPLNKFIAHCGVCGRREAADLIKKGKITVNGDIIYEPGYKVTGKEKVSMGGKTLHLKHNLVYILLNKPKDFITTTRDPEGRKTVLELVKAATPERVYPVGRLDRNTTGVLLITNDGELAQQLTHPSFEVKKIYEVTLDQPVTAKHLEQLLQGITLEDGFVRADAAGYAEGNNKNVIGIEIHSGKNRIVRRMFEHLGYDVKGLDRVMFANLTKKNVERGKWRLLQEKEVRLLKFMNQSFIRKAAAEKK